MALAIYPYEDADEPEELEFWPGGISCCGCGLRGVDVCEACHAQAMAECNAHADAENARLRAAGVLR